MKNTFLLLLLGVLCLVPLSCSKTDSRTEVESSAKVGGIAPDFTLKDISGKDTALSAYKGKVVLLEFWATWCPPCKAAVPELMALQKKYHERGFTVIGVSMDSDSDAAAKVGQFSSSHGINYPMVIANDDVPKAYNVMSIPASFLIGKEGTIIESYMGYSDDFSKNVSARIEKLL